MHKTSATGLAALTATLKIYGRCVGRNAEASIGWSISLIGILLLLFTGQPLGTAILLLGLVSLAVSGAGIPTYRAYQRAMATYREHDSIVTLTLARSDVERAGFQLAIEDIGMDILAKKADQAPP